MTELNTETENSLLGRIQSRIRESFLCDGLEGSSKALALSTLPSPDRPLCLWVCQTNREVETVAADLDFFSGGRHPIIVIPGFEADPYRGLSPHPALSEARAAALARLLDFEAGFVGTTLHSLISRLPSPTRFRQFGKHLEVGKSESMDGIISYLRQAGYVREEPVRSEGEFARRGGILDIFSPLMSHPFRVEFFGDEIDSIRLFDPATQRSEEILTECDIWPMREQLVLEEDVALWHQRAPDHWSEVRFAQELSEKLQFTENGETFNGYEYVFPLVWQNQASLIDFLASDSCSGISIVIPDPDSFFDRADQMSGSLELNYQERVDAGDLVLAPRRLFLDLRTVLSEAEERGAAVIQTFGFREDDSESVHFDFMPARKYHGRFKDLIEDLEASLEQDHRCVFVTRTSGTTRRLVEICREYDVALQYTEDFAQALERSASVCEGPLSAGFSSREFQLKVFVEEDIFADVLRRQRAPAPSRDPASVFRSDFQDLKPGDLVVHVEHGIGRFEGLKQISLEGQHREFVELMYRQEARLFVPTDRLDLLQKYSAIGDQRPRLDRLGGTSWERTKRRIKKSLQDLAEGLLKLYARRELVQGHAFAPDDSLMQEFESAFEYQETPDQMAAIQAVKTDMESQHPMDRLICGDVGYGKTEVGMRAALKAVSDGFQVALLAPTTVLAAQHLKTFRARFSPFPVRIDMLSRFRSRQQQSKTLADCSSGLLDIVIGTHRLLSEDVRFHRLGLLIIDEEQRFGVAQKEKIKSMRAQVDVLALSATPIPRTLHMSILGLRDLSIIETPPRDRLAIQTVVVRFSEKIIGSAIDLELKRNGQVFLVHNSVETIYSIAELVSRIVPEARVAVAHGQLPEKQLEEVMLKFIDREYDVLVCTTIIENGLDIPRANTLIVNRADHFGLSQLYQLRGRVGRSNRRAYAYLLIPSRETLTEVARKRLAAIREFSDLGAGFRIAAHDLELRGTGNLLGSEQHGRINAVGFELYTKLLKQAVAELRGEPWIEEVHTSIDLGLDIQIPDHYIDDATLRLWLYKRIAGITDEESEAALEAEVLDRFGKYPRAVGNLFAYGRLRRKSRPLRVASIERKGSEFYVRLQEDSPVDLGALVEMLQGRPELHLSPPGVLSGPITSNRPADVFSELSGLLEQIPVLE